MTAEVTLYTRDGCGLCEDAAALLRSLAGPLRFRLSERDVDGDPALTARYGDVVPVITVDGRELARAPLDAGALRSALTGALS